MPRLLIIIAMLAASAALLAWVLLGGRGKDTVVFDEAALFSRADIEQAQEYRRHLLANWRIDFRILTTRDTGDINMQSARKYKELGVGEKTPGGRGLLFTINTAQDKVRLEVSAGLEGTYTDAFVSYIERNMMVPYFKADMLATGIMAATEMFVTRAQQAELGIDFDALKMANFTTGAGAVTDAHIGVGVPQTNTERGSAIAADKQLLPREAYDTLLAMLAKGQMIYDPLLYTQPSIDLFSKMPMPPAAISNMYNSYKTCQVDAVKTAGPLAVLRFRPQDRKCGPMFFLLEEGRWKFDLLSIRDLVIYDFQNNWGLKKQGAAPYLFAFEDWEMSDGKKYLVPRL